MKNSLWVEKFRPKSVDDYVFVDGRQKQQVQSWINDGSIPHLLLSGEAGTGKTTLAKVLINELEIDEYDVLEINASRENSVDVVREKILGFIQTMPFGKFKIVLLDECLDENTLVHVLRNGQISNVPICNVDPTSDLVKSYNTELNKIEWMPFQKLDKGLQETYTLELENGEIVTCTGSHKWYVTDDSGELKVVRTDELTEYMHILSPK